MPESAILVENLSKSYLIGRIKPDQERYTALRDVLVRNARNISRKTLDMLQGRPILQGDEIEELWVLDNVSFEIKRGEKVGVIGRNGAGKSTLLKILSRITEPTKGKITIRGKVASLLEVGTGFHPELTGRENIRLSGTILGMSRNEIDTKFDEIVDFAEVDKFIDTPVKNYSSGMYVKLAFSVAAHLNTEILILDEVLAVGDINFQKKCLGKIKDSSTSDRTILFVSHNMAAIEQLTDSCIVLESGKCSHYTNSSTAIKKYISSSGEPIVFYDVNSTPRKILGNQHARFISLRFCREHPIFYPGEEILIEACVYSYFELRQSRISLTIFSADGNPIGSTFGPPSCNLPKNTESIIQFSVSGVKLSAGAYHFAIAVGRGDHLSGHTDYDIILNTLHFEVRPEIGIDGLLTQWSPNWGKIILPPLYQEVILATPSSSYNL